MELFISKNKNIILVTLFSLTIFLCFFHFTDTPKVWIDEGVFTEVSKNLAWHGVLGIQYSPDNYFPMHGFLLSTSYPVIFPVATSLYVFGTGVWQARLPMVFYMLLLVLMYYLFTKRRYGFLPAVFSVLLLLSFSPFYGNGRPVQGEVPGLFFIVLGLYLLLRFEESIFMSRKWAVLSGLAFGLAGSTKPSYLTLVSMSLIIVLFFSLNKIRTKKTALYFFLGLVVPISLWFYIHFPTWKLIRDIIPSYLYFVGNHGSNVSMSQTMINNAFRFVTESTPILFLFLFLVSMGILFWIYIKNKGNQIKITDIFLISFISLNILVYLPGTGWYRYFFPANVLVYLIFPSVLLSIKNIYRQKIIKIGVVLLLISLVVLQFIHLVYFSDTSFVINRTRNTIFKDELSTVDATKKIFFYNAPEAVIFLKGNNYSQYFGMDTFLVVGDKALLQKPIWDYILTDKSQSGNLALSCYTEKLLSRYYLLEKIPNCKIK